MSAPELVVRVAANLSELRQNLKEGSGLIETTKTHLQQMSNSYDGSRIISQAGATTQKIAEMGGVAKLTVAEQARVNAVVTEAIEKYRALGQQAPPSMLRLADETRGASNTMGEFRNGLSQVDRVLGSMGIQIGPHVAAVQELSAAWGKSARELGAVATAGLGLAAFMGGYQIGGLIAQHTQLDEGLGSVLARMRGWNDATEVAAHRQEVLARATQNADREITDYTEAVRINQEQQLKIVDFEKNLLQARVRVAELTEEEWRQIEAGIALGASQDLLKAKFHLTADALTVVRQRLQEKKAAEAEAQQAAEKLAEAHTELRSAGDGWHGVLSRIKPEIVEQIRHYLDAGVSQATLATAYGLTATQIKAVASAIQEERKALEESERAEEKKFATASRAIVETSRLWQEYHELIVQRTGTTTDIQIAAIERWAEGVKAKAQEAGTDTAQFYEALAAVSKEKTAAAMVDWDALREHSRLTLEDKAQRAEATYQAMLERSHEFTDAAIADFRRQAEEARNAADTWGTSFAKAGEEVERATERAATAASNSWSDAMDLVRRGLGQLSGSIPSVPGAPIWGGVVPGSIGLSTGLGASVVSRRETGGPVSAGRPYIVGERRPELFVPERSGTILPFVPRGVSGSTSAASGVHIEKIDVHVDGNVIGTQRELAGLVGDAVMMRLRGLGYRIPSGA